jgi:hypothetical protein
VPEVTAHTLSDGSSGDQWQADSWWVSDTGLQDTRNITDRRHDIRIVMPDTFAKGAIEWRLKRGFITDSTGINASYQYGGNVVSMFLGRNSGSGPWLVPLDQAPYTAAINVIHATAIADIAPVQRPDVALVAIKSKGQTFKNVTVKADRYINDWNGSAWATSTATSKNPASHYRQILYDWLVNNKFDTSLINETAMVAWRQECIDQGYECSIPFAGDQTGDALAALAVAGFARPVFSDGFAIDYFSDRSAEVPRMTFSPRNCSHIGFTIAQPERQFGYRVPFKNEDDENRADELRAVIDNAADVKHYEKKEYKAITDPDLLRRRAVFDLLQLHHRRRRWKISTSIEGLNCESGNLVSVVNDLFDDKSHGARIRQVFDSTHIALDQVIPGAAPPAGLTDASPPGVSDMLSWGERSLALISTPNGMVERTIIGVEDNVIRLDSALPSLALEGVHINITNQSNRHHRCIILEINRQSEEMAELILVDEAPQIFTKMNEQFG